VVLVQTPDRGDLYLRPHVPWAVPLLYDGRDLLAPRDSDLVGRLLPALFGTLLVALVYPVYKLGYLDKKQALIAALFLAVSPNMVYFSRFLRNDIYIAFFYDGAACRPPLLH